MKYINTDKLMQLKLENRNLLKELNELKEQYAQQQHTIETLHKLCKEKDEYDNHHQDR